MSLRDEKGSKDDWKGVKWAQVEPDRLGLRDKTSGTCRGLISDRRKQ